MRAIRATHLLSRATQKRSFGNFKFPEVKNEPNVHYHLGSPERAAMIKACKETRDSCPEIPLIINGKEVRTGNIGVQVMPSDHQHKVCTYHKAGKKEIQEAIEGGKRAKAAWEAMPMSERGMVFLRAADLLASSPYRFVANATTVLGAAKTFWQAEIDAAVETIDFWRFGAKYAEFIYEQQPPENFPNVWNRMEYRPLEGFVAAITPFNFLAIGSNLCCSPAQMGNVVMWKPSDNAILGSYYIYRILEKAGLPPGVIQFLPGDPQDVGPALIGSRDLAGLHFTGSTMTFEKLYKEIAGNISHYRSYPRIVGETGGKNFHFVHESAADQIDNIVNQTIRGAFEFNGQKCSATSRMYVPDTLWPQIRDQLIEKVKGIKVGQPDDVSSFVTAVINETSFKKVAGYLDRANQSKDCKVLVGGTYDMSQGYFIHPTVIETTNPEYETMKDELFAPVLTVFPYSPSKFEETMKACAESSDYALTGSIFASDRKVAHLANQTLRHAAGNFYVNDKCTGSIVGQQPFGGGRKSGTNDKSGSFLNLLRWVSARSIKENFMPISDYTYPSMRQ